MFLITGSLAAQNIFIIEGDTLQLQREVKGPLSLYWNLEGTTYRYFVQKNKTLRELTNANGEYRNTLEKLTADADIKTDEVKFLLYSLKHFTNQYNALVQEDYTYNTSTPNIQHRLGLFTGLSNNKYTTNPDNVMAPVLGVEFEFFDPNLAPRHVAFLQLRHSFKRDQYRYSSTQLSVNYRFKVLYFSGFDLHIDTELATLLYSEDRVNIIDEAGEVIAVEDDRGFSFTAPFSFGVGTDIRVTDVSYITLSYNDIVSLVLDGNGNFPLDFTVGYKFSL
ncbi:hypothetical protein SAMN04488034_101822 [Salinimicrobium catena]|uniref:Uncharacterized protein n=2 Tax=Salinimicrobium catena TaxID=390640 RepID=A0A1H5JQR7_9FLAO|nr:hypothetical protein SAMN04488140_101808 [Salinimicrobium catena]SEE54826.1 hypothetical protein SAMN04488034_101822 [Salinimicrobium catena]